MNGGLSTNDTQVALGEQFNDNHEITCHGREIINKKTIIGKIALRSIPNELKSIFRDQC